MKTSLLALFLFTGAYPMLAQREDAAGSKEHPMFPNRMPNYFIDEYSNNFDAVAFNLAANESSMVTKEGNKTFLNYGFDGESGKQMPSVLQILRNYEDAAKKIGGTTVFLKKEEGIGVFKLIKRDTEVWVKVQTGANEGLDYTLTIMEVQAMKQEITSNDILTALNADGYIALYINFETGKSIINSESQAVIDQLVELMNSNPELKISIEGHTDNVGTPETNKVLSLNRAKAVMSTMVAKGISAARLSSLGWGQEKSIADNRTEDGRAKNRRVEIVKK
jgi:OOP family OmpA-OmpF porin